MSFWTIFEGIWFSGIWFFVIFGVRYGIVKAMRRHNASKQSCKIIGILMLSVGFLLAADILVAFLRSYNTYPDTTAFDGAMKHYLSLAEQGGTLWSSSDTLNSRTPMGPLLPIDVGNRRVHKIAFESLPHALAAKSPSDVATLVFISEKYTASGDFNVAISGKQLRGLKLDWDVTMVDVASRSIIGKTNYSADSTFSPGQYGWTRDLTSNELGAFCNGSPEGNKNLSLVTLTNGVLGIRPQGNEGQLRRGLIKMTGYCSFCPWQHSWPVR